MINLVGIRVKILPKFFRDRGYNTGVVTGLYSDGVIDIKTGKPLKYSLDVTVDGCNTQLRLYEHQYLLLTKL